MAARLLFLFVALIAVACQEDAAVEASIFLPSNASTPAPSDTPSPVPRVGTPEERPTDPPPPAATPDRASLPSDLRLAVPRIGIDLPVILGDLGRDVPGAMYAGATPEWAAMLFPTSALPGRGGNSYIYAHAREGMFLSLWSVRLGDDVLMVSASTGATYRYTVTQVMRAVPVTDTTWLDTGGAERVTLQTSTGPAPGDPRFVVVAHRVP